MHRFGVVAALTVIVVLLSPSVAAGSSPPLAAARVDFEVFAGTGTAGDGGDGGPARSAQLNKPSGIAVGPDGTVFIADTANRSVRAIGTDGTIRRVANAGLDTPTDLAVAADGTLYIADITAFRVFALPPRGQPIVFAGAGANGFAGDGGPAASAHLGAPSSLAVGADGTVHIGDSLNGRVRAVSRTGSITTEAGNGTPQLSAAGGSATTIPVPAVSSIAIDSAGTVWWVDGQVLQRFQGGQIATVTWSGRADDHRWRLSTAATWPPPEQPLNTASAVAAAGNDLYVVSNGQLLRLQPNQTLTTVAQAGTPGPIAVGRTGEVYLVDRDGNRVLVVRAAAVTSEPAGTSGFPWWIIGAAAALIVLVVGLILAGRRRARRPPERTR